LRRKSGLECCFSGTFEEPGVGQAGGGFFEGDERKSGGGGFGVDESVEETGFFEIPANSAMTNPPPSLHCRP
jgi:hypothetical protein